MKNKLIFLLACVFALSCGKTTPDPDPVPPTPPPPNPVEGTTKAVLLLPARNEACYSGLAVSNQMSTVSFKWSASTNAENYTLVLKNLLTADVFSKTIETTQTELTIARNTPFTWYIQTKSSKNADIVESEVWKFYNAGVATYSYAPYPADLIYPAMKQNVASTNLVTLTWDGADADYDISSYSIYLGTTKNPDLIKSGQTENSYHLTVSPHTTYYWKIITKDSKGNTSESATFDFTVL